MREIGFSEMRAFAAVATQRSFAKAADQLGVSRSTLSETIRGIEEKLGVRLLNRTTRSVAPTEAGERLLARLAPLLDDFQAALDSVNDFRSSPTGMLRLTVPPPVARLLIEPLVARFLEAHPKITLEVSADGVLRDIVRERFDAGIRIGERIDRDMIATPVGDMRGTVVAAPRYLESHPRPTKPQDLQAHNCVRVRFPSGAFKPWPFEKGGKQLEVAVEGNLIVNTETMQNRAALDGVGIAYTLVDFVEQPLREGKLVALLEDWIPRLPSLYLYYPSRRQVPGPLQAFVDFLRRERRVARATKR
ncbi:MAG TPA: LysR family transcriptional regulator [Alphaproteobacteria bacterium]|nr:LysR family transcriptional regulator [Alphaproteobacteria bacterium]